MGITIAKMIKRSLETTMRLGLTLFRIVLNTLALLLIPVDFYACTGKADRDNSKYTIGTFEGSRDFSKLTSQELQLDSLLKVNPWFTSGFKNNRSRIFLEEFQHDIKQHTDPVFAKGAPAPCMCFLDKDTINIKTWLGFFGGYVFLLKIYKDEFNLSYIPSMDESIYKADLSDTMFHHEVIVNSKLQKMVLLEKPDFRLNEQITGFVEFTTNGYYVKRMEERWILYSILVKYILPADQGKGHFDSHLRILK